MTYIITYYIPLDEATPEERKLKRDIKGLFNTSGNKEPIVEHRHNNEIIRTLKVEVPGKELEKSSELFESCQEKGMIPRTATFSCWDKIN